MTNYLVLYLACALVFFPLDFLWLGTVGRSVYRRELGGLLLARPDLVVAGLFYLGYVAGIVVLVAAPAEGDVLRALLYGAVLGLVAYGTYDLTNLSTLRGFSPLVTAIDMAWGAALTAAGAAGAVWLARVFA